MGRGRSTPHRGACMLAALVAASLAPCARADVFNGRIGFSSDRAVPPAGGAPAFDIFSMDEDG